MKQSGEFMRLLYCLLREIQLPGVKAAILGLGFSALSGGLLVALAPISVAAQAAQFDPSKSASSTAPSSRTVSSAPLSNALRAGDRLKIVFYESLQSDEDQWNAPPGRRDLAPKGFYQRPELTGEYLVDDDGNISLPLLGRFPVRGLLPRAVETSIVHSYETLVDKKGFVNILSVERQPIYVEGAVKNSGTFEYSDGMTVLHAVAAAGGMQAQSLEPWQKVEIKRQIERLKTGLSDLKRMAARTEVLRATRDNVRMASIDESGLGLNQDGRQLMNDEEWQRRLVTVSQDAQHDALTKAVENAQADLDLRQARVGTYDDNINNRRDRLASIETLAKNKLVVTSELTRVRSELSDAEDRKQQAVIDVESAKQRLAIAKQDLERHGVESKIEIEKSVSDAERGMSAALQTTESDLEIFQSMVASSELGEGVNFEIVHRGDNGIVVQSATEETVLQPGDLVRVR